MKMVATLAAGILVVASAAFTMQDQGAGREAQRAGEGLAQSGPGYAVANAAEVEEVTELWVRPEGPLRVTLQAGHWKAAEAPDEQAGLRNNGTRGGGKAEWEVNLEIARRTAALLDGSGYIVEILPTTVPPGYWADLFVSIHADGSPSPTISGFRAAAPRRDATGRAAEFVEVLHQSYGRATGLPFYPTVTRRMLGYYAFNWRRYEHALHPMTVGVILETGFLTSPSDRRIIVNQPERAAQGIASAILQFMETMPLEPTPLPPARLAPPVRPFPQPVTPTSGR